METHKPNERDDLAAFFSDFTNENIVSFEMKARLAAEAVLLWLDDKEDGSALAMAMRRVDAMKHDLICAGACCADSAMLLLLAFKRMHKNRANKNLLLRLAAQAILQDLEEERNRCVIG